MDLLIMVPMIHRSKVSNGIKVMLDIALHGQNSDIMTFVYPTFCDPFLTPLQVDEKFHSLNISKKIPEGCTALIPDTAELSDVNYVRTKAEKIIWYSLALPGMFSQCNIPFIPRLPGEEEIVYSPQVSRIFKQLYVQPKYNIIEELVEGSPDFYFEKKRNLLEKKCLNICFYQGKGQLKGPYPKLLQKLIKNSKTSLITRDYPTSKHGLYSLLSKQDFLISLDPLTSVNYEASLLGLPVYVHSSWDEPFQDEFPVSLEGISFSDIDLFREMLKNGVNTKAIYNSYKNGLKNNNKNLNKFFDWLKIISSSKKLGNEKLRTISYTNDLYWRTRLQSNASTSPMELNIVYNKDYIKSGGQWSKKLLLKLSILLVRKNLRIVKNIIFFPKNFIQSKLSEFKRYIMS
ncbi:hypothetical protein [uncultured Prochlorococcus sp.]|uniref:hypothetical protein n=1 Tax=uncultured Prochlorococcus sp. TaxID=159733 RepID=UPI0025863C18|nr:hypothetical protein [uncultured Prochlorococcus sp.]